MLSRLSQTFIGLLVALAAPGCIPNFGTGGTGERVIPRAKLRRVDPLDLTAFARPDPPAPSTAPATGPATGPSSQPATQLSGPQPPPPPKTELSITDVRRLALENNLDLKVELLNPEIARQSLTAEQARYEALLSANVSYATTDAAVASQLTGSQTDNRSIDAGLEIPLITGGRFRFNFPINRFENNNAFTLLNPAYATSPGVTISQPLLRGAGFDVNAQPIRVAFYAYQSAQARTKLTVTRVLADAERVYWRLYAARQELELRLLESRLAVAQLDRARRQAAAGVVPEVDVIRAESGAADREEAIILARNAVSDRQREMKRILNVGGLEMESVAELVPVSAPVAVMYRLDGPALARAALDGRMEIVEEELRIAEEEANVRVARNDTLPLVTLEYTYGVNGLGPALDDALSQVREKRFEDHRIGLRLEVPIGNQAAESRLRRAILGRYQRLASRDQRALQIRQEVLNAVDQLEANRQRIVSARNRVVLAERVRLAEQRQFDLGLRTSTDVLDALTRLADAKSSEIAAVAEYQIAQVDIAFATGTVLGASHVVWQPTVAPDERGRR